MRLRIRVFAVSPIESSKTLGGAALFPHDRNDGSSVHGQTALPGRVRHN